MLSDGSMCCDCVSFFFFSEFSVCSSANMWFFRKWCWNFISRIFFFLRVYSNTTFFLFFFFWLLLLLFVLSSGRRDPSSAFLFLFRALFLSFFFFPLSSVFLSALVCAYRCRCRYRLYVVFFCFFFSLLLMEDEEQSVLRCGGVFAAASLALSLFLFLDIHFTKVV